jgi:hypothetical protein
VHYEHVFDAKLHPGVGGGAEFKHGEESGWLVVLEWEAGNPVRESIESILIF